MDMSLFAVFAAVAIAGPPVGSERASISDSAALVPSAQHAASAQHDPAVPGETGQSAYAALAEVVQILLADPATDWSRVNIDRLRGHLVDMNAVTLGSSVETARLANGARFTVVGDGATVESIQRMAQAHFTQSDFGAGWSTRVDATPGGAVVTVTSDDPLEARKIGALGFYGIITMGAHHQSHHLRMARGTLSH